MPHETALIVMIAAGMGLAFVFGLAAVRLRLPPLVGYLVAGVVVGPFTPGFVADVALAQQLAEIGVILLMFGVGIHFSVADLMAVRRIAVPGAIVQIAIATALGGTVAHLWGWSWGSGMVFGLCLSVASTVVLLRALEDRDMLDSIDGRIAVGWLIVEDLATVLVLVLLPALAVPLGGTAAAGTDAAGSEAGFFTTLGITLAKVAAFVVLMFVVGRRTVPWLLERVARTGSRELFTLSVLAVAIGIAVGAAALFGVSFALGAFFAGMVVNGSHLSHKAAEDAVPLQDAFSVLFFVAVGMLFDPAILVRQPLEVLAVVLIVMIGKSFGAFIIVLVFRYPVRTALTISASLAQIGEFSFILAGLALTLNLLPPEGQSLIVAGSLLSIALNPLAFAAATRIARWIGERPRLAEALERSGGPVVVFPPSLDESQLRDHVVLIGYGRVGAPLADELALHGIPFVIVEQSHDTAESLRERGLPVIFGDATRPSVLAHAHIERARLVVIAAPDAYQARAILKLARRLNPEVEVVVRTHSDKERTFLEGHGAERALVGERELAVSLARHALRRFQVAHDMEAVAERALGRRAMTAPAGDGPSSA
jgi:CPA2 family monovalent cation:H+ antiporter-2